MKKSKTNLPDNWYYTNVFVVFLLHLAHIFSKKQTKNNYNTWKLIKKNQRII